MARYKSKWTGPQIDDGIEAAFDAQVPILSVRLSVDASADMEIVDAAWGKKPIFAKYTKPSGYSVFVQWFDRLLFARITRNTLRQYNPNR